MGYLWFHATAATVMVFIAIGNSSPLGRHTIDDMTEEEVHSTGRMGWMAHRKWKEIKQQPGTAGPGNMLGCSLVSFHFLWAIHPIRPVEVARFPPKKEM